MHTKRINYASQAILPLVENMNEAMTSGKYGIAIMTDLEGAFDSIWREGAEITNNLLLVLASFLKHRQYKHLANTHTGSWSNTVYGVP